MKYTETMKTERNKSKNVYLTYSLLFLFMCLIIYSYYYLHGRTLIFSGDAWYQHFKALVYYSDYLKTIFKNLFLNHRLEIPLWDFSIGEGSDIISSLHYYCIGDPLSFFSVFFPEKLLYWFFDFSILLRMYICGLIFIRLCIYTKVTNKYAILSGSMAYVFCYWNLLNSVKHIFFLNPMVYLPLVILGVEKIVNGDKPYLLSVSVTFCALSNFYFFYMIVVLTVLYVAIRLLLLYKTDIRSMLNCLQKIFISSLLGFLVSAVISFPFMYAMLTNSRLSVDYGSHLIYPFFYYDRLITIFLTTDNYYWLCMGFASPVILSTLLIFKQARKKTLLFCLNLFTLIMILFPFFGKLLNGFSYISNRWSFAIALLVSYTFTIEWEEIAKNKKYLLISTILFSLVSFVTAWWRTVKIVPIFLCFVFLFAAAYSGKAFSDRKKQMIMLLVVLLSILYTADYSNSIRGRNRASGAISIEDAKNVVTATDAFVLKSLVQEENSSFFRYSGSDLMENTAMLNGVYSTNYYFSLANPSVSDFRSKTGINEYPVHWYDGYDNRCILNTLANVAYYIAPADYEGYIPYGFVYEKEADGYKLYKNENALSFGYTYDSFITYEEWEKLSQIEKEEALMHDVVLNKEGSGIKPSVKTAKIDYEIVADSDLFEVDEHSIFVKEGGSTLKVVFNGRQDCQHFISFDNLEYDAREAYFFGDEMTEAVMKFLTSDGHTNRIEYHTKDYQFYNGKHYFSAYLGTEPITEVEITFTRGGYYTFDEMYISCLPLNDYEESIRLLNKEHMYDVSVLNNCVTGKIDVEKDKYLLLSIPYSESWKAYVDGQETELYQANDAYIALALTAGHHEIELRYSTPLLSCGSIVSASSALVLAASIYLNEKKR